MSDEPSDQSRSSRPPTFDDFGDVMSLSDVAQLMGLHLETVRDWARQGHIPARRMPGGKQRARLYVMKDDLREFLFSQPLESQRSTETDQEQSRRR